MSLVIARLGALRESLRTRTDRALENLALRQQLVLLRRRSKRPQFGRLERLFWVWLSDQWAEWRDALHVVRPQTVIRWHRQGFRAFWTWKSNSAHHRWRRHMDVSTQRPVRGARESALWTPARVGSWALRELSARTTAARPGRANSG